MVFFDIAGSTDVDVQNSMAVTVACGALGTMMYITTDPTVWNHCVMTHVNSGYTTTTTYYAIEFVNNKFIAVGNYGTVAVSDDGIHFRVYQVYPDAVFNSVAYGNGLYVVTGRTIIAYSYDAENWNYIRGEEVEIDDDTDEHQRNEFRSYYQRPCLRLKHIFNRICAESDYTVELDPVFFQQ